MGLTLPPALRLVGQAAETAVTAESRAETVVFQGVITTERTADAEGYTSNNEAGPGCPLG